MKLFRFFIILILFGFCLSVFTDAVSSDATRGVSGQASARPQNSRNQIRLALVIGNSKYKSAPLKNPVNDASDIATALRRVNFDVIHVTNAGLRQMEDNIRNFGRKLRRADIGLFFYAGHGVQVNDTNYLIPVGADIQKESDVKYEAVNASRVLDEMASAESRINIVILDACRNNPFARSLRSSQAGLARLDAPTWTQTLIAYATSPGYVAVDGEGRNSPFTGHLLRHIEKPGIPLEKVLKNVRKGVLEETGGKQVPWESTSVYEDFFFVPLAKKVEPPPPVLKSALTVEANLKGAKIFVDGRGFGSTPLFNKEIRTGQHLIRVERSGYESHEREVRIRKGQLLSMYVELIPVVPEPSKPQPEPLTPDPVLKKPPKPSSPVHAKNWKDAVTGMEFRWIPAGCFRMGSLEKETERFPDETPAHQVCLDGFWMGKYEVTQGQWQRIMGANPSSFTDCGGNCPVENVSWVEVQNFIVKLAAKHKGKIEFRLPTEAEWEYACRAGTSDTRFWGDNPVQACSFANVADYSAQDQYWDWAVHSCDDGFVHTAPGGKFKPNAFGLYDMLGNVWEWCLDVKGDDAYRTHGKKDPVYMVTGRDIYADYTSKRVLRGGSWKNMPAIVRSARRHGLSPSSRKEDIGFRLVRTR